MRLLSIVHLAVDPPGILADCARERGWEHDEWPIHEGVPPPDVPEAYDAVALFGGDMAVEEEQAYPWLRWEKEHVRRVLARGIPAFGVCLGGQLLASVLGAPVTRAAATEIGWYDVELTPEARSDPLFGGLPQRLGAFEWHSWRFDLPRGAVPLARNEVCLQAYRLGESVWGVQFHPEVTEEMLPHWLEAATTDEEARAIGFDYDEQAALSERNAAEWRAVGRTLFSGFLDVAEKCAARGEARRASA